MARIRNHIRIICCFALFFLFPVSSWLFASSYQTGQSLTIRNYVDRFGDPTSDKYITQSGRQHGLFTNSATTNEDMEWYIIVSEDEVSFVIYEYERTRLLGSAGYPDKYDIYVKAGSNTSYFSGLNRSDRISLNSKESDDFITLMRENDSLKIQIEENTIYTATKYDLGILDCSGFTRLWEQIYGRDVNTAITLADNLYSLIVDEFQPEVVESGLLDVEAMLSLDVNGSEIWNKTHSLDGTPKYWDYYLANIRRFPSTFELVAQYVLNGRIIAETQVQRECGYDSDAIKFTIDFNESSLLPSWKETLENVESEIMSSHDSRVVNVNISSMIHQNLRKIKFENVISPFVISIEVIDKVGIVIKETEKEYRVFSNSSKVSLMLVSFILEDSLLSESLEDYKVRICYARDEMLLAISEEEFSFKPFQKELSVNIEITPDDLTDEANALPLLDYDPTGSKRILALSQDEPELTEEDFSIESDNSKESSFQSSESITASRMNGRIRSTSDKDNNIKRFSLGPNLGYTFGTAKGLRIGAFATAHLFMEEEASLDLRLDSAIFTYENVVSYPAFDISLSLLGTFHVGISSIYFGSGLGYQMFTDSTYGYLNAFLLRFPVGISFELNDFFSIGLDMFLDMLMYDDPFYKAYEIMSTIGFGFNFTPMINATFSF